MEKQWFKQSSLNGPSFRRCFRQSAWVLLAALGLVGCELTADNVKVPETKAKLVVTSFISPQDTLLTVIVTKSAPIYSQTSGTSEVNNATVALSDGTTSVSLAYISDGKYTSPTDNLPIIPGRSYFLTVTTPDGFLAKATCTVPVRANDAITSIRIDSATTEQVPGYPYKEYHLTVEWQDTSGEGDYYRLFAERPYAWASGLDPSNPSKVDTLYSQVFFKQGQEYATDAGQDGRKFIIRDGKFQANTNNTSNQFKVNREINVILLTTDKNYYQYHRGLVNYTNDNPFAEPTLLYSNVEGGLGVFAAYQQFKRVFRY